MDFVKLLLKLVGVSKNYMDDAQKNERPIRQASPQPVEPSVVKEKTSAEWKTYFKQILLSEFPSYDIRENVPVTELAGFANDEFKLYKTRPMLGNGHSHDSNVKYLIARMYAKKLGIPYINFYTQMPNEREYVIGRIRKLMA